MTNGSEEDRTGHEYDHWAGESGLAGKGLRFLFSPRGIRLLHPNVSGVIRALGLSPEHRVLDIGCGMSAFLLELDRRLHFRTSPEGIDASPGMIELGRRYLQETSATTRIDIRVAKATEVPFPDSSFDVAVCSYVIKYMGDDSLARAFAEARRVLVPGGKLALWEFGPSLMPFFTSLSTKLLKAKISTVILRTEGHVADLMQSAGFVRVSLLGLGPHLIIPWLPRVALVGVKP
ncbi:MAG: class I SAM-dependent methyltransferase [Chloroflexi bacterium]|nr:class I SAM-dependent methyltransferase [Chloroflexota bacterium]